MGELVYGSDESLEADTPLDWETDTIRELGGVPLRLLARIDARHMDTPDDKLPTPSQALRALHAEQDRYPSDEIAA